MNTPSPWSALNRFASKEPPAEDRLRQSSLYWIVPALAWLFLPLPLFVRIAMILAVIPLVHLFVSLLWYRQMTRHQFYETVFIGTEEAGGVALVAAELGAELGIEHWTYTTSSRGGRSAVGLLPDADVDSLVSLTSSNSDRTFVDFVGRLSDGRLLITSYRRRPIVPWPNARWCYNVDASPEQCWEQHRTVLCAEGVRSTRSDLIEAFLLPAKRPNFFGDAGLLTFARTWPVSVWRAAGCVSDR